MGISARPGQRPPCAFSTALTLAPLAGFLLAGCVETGGGAPLNVSQSPAAIPIAAASATSTPSTHAGTKFIQPAFEMRTIQALAGPAVTEIASEEPAPAATGTAAAVTGAAAAVAIPKSASIAETDLIQSPSMPDLTMADRIVALQTQTMLAGLACDKVWGDAAAFQRYADFTVRNSSLLRSSQLDVAARLGGLAHFDKMHTRISNGESKRLIDLGDMTYCAEMKKPFYVVVSLDAQRLADMAMDHRTMIASLQ
jgi:hypothetical protein